MIKINKSAIVIFFLPLFLFLGYNVLTTEATIEEKDISKMKFVNDDLDDYGLKNIAIEQECKDNGGEWKDNSWCKFNKAQTGDEKKFEHQLEDRGLSYYYADAAEAGSEEWDKYQQEKYEAEQEEIAAKEDDICDDEDADITNIKLCMSEDIQLEKELKKACDADDNAKWTETGCVVGEVEPTEEDIKERAKMTQSETFKNLLESKGIDYEDYDNLSAEKQEEIETEFKEDKSDEYAEELRSKELSNPEVKPKLLVPNSLEGTLTEEQKEALSKENPNWEFDKSYVNIPNSLEGKLTQEQMETLSEENYDVEYEWEDTASNPVPDTPSYEGPEEEEKRYVNPNGGAPLYEDELTEDEKNYYEEYKPKK